MMAKKARKVRDDKKRNQEKFLAAYAAIGITTKAAKAAGLCPSEPYHWLKEEGPHGDEYRSRLAKAEKEAEDALEAEARRRAVDGLKRFKFFKGAPIIDPDTVTEQNPQGTPYYELEYSDTLLIFLLKGINPEKYRDRQSVDMNSKVEVKDVTVAIDGNWYGNANRLAAVGVATPTADPAIPVPTQVGGVRAQVGQNGNRSNGNGHGAWPAAGGNGRSH
jgi:hypothetical protein